MLKNQKATITRSGVFEFGTFRANLDTFELFSGAQQIAVEPQVFSLLSYLIQNRDRLVTKEELLDELWGHRYVSESALSTQIKSLRKAVGDDGQRQSVIQTVRGRGYRFVASLEKEFETPRLTSASDDTQPAHNLPRERTPLFGRALDVDRCLDCLDQGRLVTILGIGGTGKTRLALRVGREAVARYPDGVWLVDLIPLTDIESLEIAIANLLGMALAASDTRPQLINALQQRELLLIFDNCEHLREAAADLINDLLEYTERPRILATSRDPLDLIDEYRFFLNPLATHLGDAMSPAVELFMATAQRHGVVLAEELLTQIGQICSQLDGLPLAIELAAAQLRHLTLEELSLRLEKRFDVLSGRERSSSGRQNNLLGVLEDTWDMLNEAERALLRQLAVFPSRFTMTSLEELLADMPHDKISTGISRLVDLGLMQRTSDRGSWWRVLETVRAFAAQGQLEADKDLAVARHAYWSLSKLGRFPDDQLDNLSQAEWCLEHYPDLDAAERFFARSGRHEDAYAICAGTGLMVQLDDGARAKEKLIRAEHYLAGNPTPYWQARLHAIAGLSAQANRLPDQLLAHTKAYIRLSRGLDDPELLANALLMQSLTTGFVDADKAQEQLSEMIELGERANNASLVQSGNCYRAWQYVMSRDYQRGRDMAQQLIERYIVAPDSVDNPAYNAIGIIVTCTVVDEPDVAVYWAAKIKDFPAAISFWGIQNLLACVEASAAHFAAAAQRCLDIKVRLNRAARDEFPDVLVTAILLAVRKGETDLAQKWLAAIRYSRVPIQMYHTIAIYRQLYELLGFGDYSAENAPPLDEIRPSFEHWLTHMVERGA